MVYLNLTIVNCSLELDVDMYAVQAANGISKSNSLVIFIFISI